MSTLLFIFLNDLFLLFVRIRISKLFMNSFIECFPINNSGAKKKGVEKRNKYDNLAKRDRGNTL